MILVCLGSVLTQSVGSGMLLVYVHSEGSLDFRCSCCRMILWKV